MEKITIDEKEYLISDFNDNQKALLAHIQDLDNSINIAKFKLEQAEFSKHHFINALKETL